MGRMIDADALKEYIHNQDGRPFIGITIGEAFQMMVDEQPTIEERKTGEWIDNGIHSRAFDIFGVRTWVSRMVCDQCGFVIHAIEGSIEQYNFCPNCGADMRGEQNEHNH